MLIKITSIYLLLSSVFLFSGCSGDLLNQTPKCSDKGVVETLSKVLSTDSRKVTIDLDMIRQVNLDEQNGMRTCQTSVNYAYSVGENSGFIGKAIDGFKMGIAGSEGVSNNNNIVYTVVLGETGKKYIVTLQ